MRRETDSFFLPAGQTKKRADPNSPKARIVAALRAIEPPVEIALRTRRVQVRVNLAIVRLLINNEALGARLDNWNVVGRRHRTDFDRDRGKIRPKSAHAIGQICPTNELRVLSRDEQDLAKSRARQMTALCDDLIDTEGHAQDGIVPGKAAVAAIVDAFVREIKRREKTHGASEILQGQFARLLRQIFELRIGLGRNQILEAMEEPRFLQREIIEKLGKGHWEQFLRLGSQYNYRGGRPEMLRVKKNAGNTYSAPGVLLNYAMLFRPR